MRYLFIAASLLFIATHFATDLPDTNWTEYNGDGARSHYSPLTPINASTLHQLKTAIDLNTGEHRWQVPLGEYQELTPKVFHPLAPITTLAHS